MKTYYITTLGCPKNVADSREMERSLADSGFSQADSADSADYHLINSCAFIEEARIETIQTVLTAGKIKKKSKGAQKLVLVGCFSERYATEVSKDLPEVDLAFGTGRYHEAASIIGKAFPDSTASAPQHELPPNVPSVLQAFKRSDRPYAPVKISDGCDRGCTFCAIPLFRGKFRDIPLENILTEARRLTETGVREICLVSQDSNSYGGSPDAYIDLLKQLHTVEGLTWIRMLYMYPDSKTERILKSIGESALPKLVPYLESPVQHASANVLKSMRRIGDRNKFSEIFKLARSVMPGAEIRTSFLIGFPGETARDIDEILKFIEDARPEKIALFSYSPEEGTPGATMQNPVSKKEIQTRMQEIRAAYLEIQKLQRLGQIGRIHACMVDGVEEGGYLVRRAQDAPEVDGSVLLDTDAVLTPGDIVNVKITGFTELDLVGTLEHS